MNKSMKLICKEIMQGNNLDINIGSFFNRLVSVYDEYASLNLTMNYYTFYENSLEATYQKRKEEEDILQEVNSIIDEYILNEFTGKKMEEGIKKTDSIRNKIMKEMKILTAYTDIFLVYEYVLQRVKYRFEDDMDLETDEELTSQIIKHIFEVNDNIIINDKIKEIIGELPVRMTRTKYFDLLRDSISIYKGGDRSSLDNYIYMIETASTLHEPEGMHDSYTNLLDFKEELETLNYQSLTNEQYNLFREKLDGITLFINDRVNFYYGLQEIVNNLYAMLLTKPYAYMDGGYRLEGMEGEMKYLILPPGKNDNACKEIITNINKLFAGNETVSLDETEDKLWSIEGVQEKLFEEIQVLEPVLYHISINHEELVENIMLHRVYKSLKLCENLLGNSLFVELEQMQNEVIADEEYIRKVQDDIINKLQQLFGKTSKMVIRAIMAGTLNKMPVFFHSSDDVVNYIKNSLEQCQDIPEKKASIEIIKEFCEM